MSEPTCTASVARCSWAVSQTPAFHRLPISRIAGSADTHRPLDTHRLRAAHQHFAELGGVEPHRRLEEPIQQLGPGPVLGRVPSHDVDGLARGMAPGDLVAHHAELVDLVHE